MIAKISRFASLDTLGESGTDKIKKNQVIVTGEGSDLSKTDALKGRAKRKTITQIMMLELIKIAEENGDLEFVKSYWNTYHCQQNIVTSNGRLYGKYCKNRFCTLCSSIRKAEIINSYYPIMRTWDNPQMLTLTVKSCKADRLRAYFHSLNDAFIKIHNKHKKRSQRGTGTKLMGIRSLESNFNPKRRWYNPHFHIITANKEMGEILMEDWYQRSKKGYVNLQGQKMEEVWNLESALVEVIKYGSKIFTEPDLRKNSKTEKSKIMYLRALHTIYVAMKGINVFNRFGFNGTKELIISSEKAKKLSSYQEWEYNMKHLDWQNTSTGELLTGFEWDSNFVFPSENLLNTIMK